MAAQRGLPLRILETPWRRRGFAFTLGALGALALPPLYVLPAIWLSLSGYVLLNVSAQTKRQAAFEGWLFGLGWFSCGLYWIGYAFLVDSATYGALMPFAVVGISAGMAVYMALLSVALHWLRTRCELGMIWIVSVFASLWTIAEWFRGWFLTGFPWNPLASVWGFSSEIMQSVAVMGALGLGFVSAMVFAAPTIWLARRSDQGKHALTPVLIITCLVPILWGGGYFRLSDASTLTRDDAVIRLVQPSIPQALKWQSDLRRHHVLKQMSMSKRTTGPAGQPNIVIWAETNVPFLIEDGSDVTSALAAAVPEDGTLIFGAPRRDQLGKVYNSLLAIGRDSRISGTFDKFHLVPFGEYVPLRGILPIEKLTAGRGDFTPGPGPRTLHLPGVPPFAPIICYEVIFSGRIIDAADRPDWILNITNDAWFGPSSGPQQHLVQAQLRAIEEGLPLVRSANNGISAVIDAYGRLRNKLGLDQIGVVDAPLPVAIDRTLYSRIGDLPMVLVALVALILAVAVGRPKGAFQ